MIPLYAKQKSHKSEAEGSPSEGMESQGFASFNRSIPSIDLKKTIEGWIIIEIHGEPFERGFAHGYLLYKEIRKNKKKVSFIVSHILKTTMTEYLKQCRMLKQVIQKKFPEIYEEIRGISSGCQIRGTKISVLELIAWNSTESFHSFFKPLNNSEGRISHNDDSLSKCSAFIATGDATEKGDIVMAHNTHCDFITGQSFNIIIYITPTNGFPFVMQTAAGLISSTTDWFICSTGIMGCETTIASINYRPHFGSPYYCRIREAMQYGKTLDDYTKIMLKDNAGDYACSWQLGDINTNEIMLFEIGLREHSIQRTKNGIFYGMNSAMDIMLRTKETKDQTHFDTETSSGARNQRLQYLLHEKYYGHLDITKAKMILQDHYDVFLYKNRLGSRGICKHSELDSKSPKNPYYPFGCVDGKVVDTEMAKNLNFCGRFGSSCGRIFHAREHLQKYPEYNYMKDLLEDFPKQNWTLLSSFS